MWQEGVARYTELTVARWAARQHAPSEEFRALADYTSYSDVARSIAGGIRAELRGDAGSTRRVAFYAIGAATALLLDDVAPGWRTRYPESGFTLDALPRR
jgi:hypothetical protein